MLALKYRGSGSGRSWGIHWSSVGPVGTRIRLTTAAQRRRGRWTARGGSSHRLAADRGAIDGAESSPIPVLLEGHIGQRRRARYAGQRGGIGTLKTPGGSYRDCLQEPEQG